MILSTIMWRIEPTLPWQPHCIHFPCGKVRLARSRIMSPNVENAIAAPITEAARQHEVDGFVGGTSPAMLTLEAVLAEIAHTNIPVLLVGECGTGKQMFAHRIHQLSERSEPLMKVSCAGMRAESFASELGLDAGRNANTGAMRGPCSSMKSANSTLRAKGIYCTRCLTEKRNRDAEF